MTSLPRRSLLLLEDVDAALPEAVKRRNESQQSTQHGSPAETDDQSGVTLSGLLNCMDGITAPEGVVIVMTTNFPERLDAALLRPGRIDYRMNFGPATREQIERMRARLNPNADVCEFALQARMTTAQVQAYLMEQVH